ncbi:mucin-5AC [Engraulis encrasicolus]|uniref:mucin-5AC n=1 Tax=Engraulis encrasicolus TaxID=184585 RepID=UPI002FD4E9E1
MRGINRRMKRGTVDFQSAIADKTFTDLITRLLFLWIISSSSLQAHGIFMYDSKAVLGDCRDYWTFQDRGRIPLLFQMTVCVDVRVVSPGRWLAFSYSSPRAPRFDLALEGDPHALYAWLLGVRHRFPVQLAPHVWHRLCLRRDSLRNTFSMEVNGSTGENQRTVIARVIPPNGELRLGCMPRDATPGDARGKVELYLFRMWGDVGQHRACEDGSVAGWQSRMWSISHSRTRAHDDQLGCGKTWQKRRLLSNVEKVSQAPGQDRAASVRQNGRNAEATQVPDSGAKDFVSTPATTTSKPTTLPLTMPLRTTLPAQSSSTTTTDAHTVSTVTSTAKATTSGRATGASTTPKETSPPPPSPSSSSLTPSPQQATAADVSNTTTHTTTTTHQPPSTSPPSTSMTFDPENGTMATTPTTSPQQVATAPSTTAPLKGSQNSSVSPYPPTTVATTRPTQTTATSPSAAASVWATTSRFSPARTSSTPSTTSSSRLPTGSHSTAVRWSTAAVGQIVMQCNFSQFCANTTSYYWMMTNVTVTGPSKTEADIKAWFSQFDGSIPHIEPTDVNCTDKTTIQRTTCRVQLQLQESISTCDLRRLIQNSDHGDISVTVLGDVERVGKGLCVDEDQLPPRGDFVRCTYPEPYDGMCLSKESVNVTCSYLDSEPNLAPSSNQEQDSCTIAADRPDKCDCTGFCRENDKYYYALRLNITNATITLKDIQDMIFKNTSDCDADIPHCMVALMLDRLLDVCVVSRVMAFRLQGSRGVHYDGLLTRMAICGGPDSNSTRLLDANLTWFSSSLTADDFCESTVKKPLTW